MSDHWQPRGLQPFRLLCPWDSPGKNTGVGTHSLLQGIFQTQGLNPGLLHCRQIFFFLTIWALSKVLPIKTCVAWVTWAFCPLRRLQNLTLLLIPGSWLPIHKPQRACSAASFCNELGFLSGSLQSLKIYENIKRLFTPLEVGRMEEESYFFLNPHVSTATSPKVKSWISLTSPTEAMQNRSEFNFQATEHSGSCLSWDFMCLWLRS